MHVAHCRLTRRSTRTRRRRGFYSCADANLLALFGVAPARRLACCVRLAAPLLARLGTCMKTISARHRWLLFFLGLAVSAWGIGLGAKLFELTVLIPAWAANPPQSLNLLPYGPRWPHNPGDFVQPLSAALLLATIGTLAAGWKTRPPYKSLLWLSLGALILIWASTPTLFWPMIRDL